MEPITIKNKAGNPIKVKGFRDRREYKDNLVYSRVLLGQEQHRFDKIAYDLYGSVNKMSGLIDINDKDIYFINPGELFSFVESGEGL